MKTVDHTSFKILVPQWDQAQTTEEPVQPKPHGGSGPVYQHHSLQEREVVPREDEEREPRLNGTRAGGGDCRWRDDKERGGGGSARDEDEVTVLGKRRVKWEEEHTETVLIGDPYR